MGSLCANCYNSLRNCRPKEVYLKEISNVDYESICVGFDSDPLGILHQLQTTNLILIENGEEVAVGVRHQTKCLW